MAVVTTMIYLFIMLFAPQRGLVSKWRIKRSHEMRIVIEDILKILLKGTTEENNNIQRIGEKTVHSSKVLKQYLQKMQALGLVDIVHDSISLTENGKIRADQLLRAHRLWEVYLVEELGLAKDQIHEEAEKFEHSLTDEEIREMDKSLGYPAHDPHGSPIPR